jgi:hypothetical protein
VNARQRKEERVKRVNKWEIEVLGAPYLPEAVGSVFDTETHVFVHKI